MTRGSRGFPYSLLLEVAIVLLLPFALEISRSVLSNQETMGIKDPARLIVIIIVAEPTFLKAFLKLNKDRRMLSMLENQEEEVSARASWTIDRSSAS